VTFDFQELSLTEVTRSFGRRRALWRVNLTVASGEIVGLLGPNGAGKSTLLSLVSTLVAPSSGEIRYGRSTSHEAGPSLRARIGMLGHDLFLYPELTARENLAFFARLYALRDVDAVVDRALAQANLADRGDDQVSGYSRGMRQRLALERALLHQPRLLLLDEPFTGLDDASGQALVARLRTLRDEGCIVLVATHDLDLADGLLDRVAVLRDGRLVLVEQAEGSLRARYRSALAAAPLSAGSEGR
jgi:heme exporter protein A